MFQVKLSVRELVEFVLREGDIDNTQGGGNLVERALEGARLHRRLQKEAGEGYEAEVFLSHEEVLEDILYHVEGRADGIFETPQGDVIDEIKTVEFPLDRLTEEYQPLHWAQAKCYGYEVNAGTYELNTSKDSKELINILKENPDDTAKEDTKS